MKLYPTISTPLYSDRMVAKQNVKKTKLPNKNLKTKNTNKPRNVTKNNVAKKMNSVETDFFNAIMSDLLIRQYIIKGFVGIEKFRYTSDEKIKREMRIENRRKRKHVLQTYQRPYDAKAENLAQMVTELESYDNDTHNAYKAMFDTMCWVSEMKEYEAHQQQIEQVKENIRLSLKAYEYTNAGKEKDEQDAKVLRKKNVSSQIKESSDDDIKNCLAEISVACQNRFLLHSRVKILLADCKKYNIR